MAVKNRHREAAAPPKRKPSTLTGRKLLHASGQDTREFKLRLQKERDVELASIQVQRDVAQANAGSSPGAQDRQDRHRGRRKRLLREDRPQHRHGEIGGSPGAEQPTLADIKDTFFSGDPEHFKTQLCQWVADFGINPRLKKNLTLSPCSPNRRFTDDTGEDTLKSALALVKGEGMGEVRAETVLKQA